MAIKDYNKALELKPDAEAYSNRGIAYFKKGEFDLAIKDYNKALELKSDYAEAYSNRGNAHLRKGDVNIALRDYWERRRGGENWIAKITGLDKKYGYKREFLRTVSKIISRLEKIDLSLLISPSST